MLYLEFNRASRSLGSCALLLYNCINVDLSGILGVSILSWTMSPPTGFVAKVLVNKQQKLQVSGNISKNYSPANFRATIQDGRTSCLDRYVLAKLKPQWNPRICMFTSIVDSEVIVSGA